MNFRNCDALNVKNIEYYLLLDLQQQCILLQTKFAIYPMFRILKKLLENCSKLFNFWESTIKCDISFQHTSYSPKSSKSSKTFFAYFSLIRDVLHRGDRAMIYLFIAGSYTPWLTLKAYDSNGWAVQLNWVIWILATLGIIYQQIFHERYKWLETTIYMTVALAPSLAVFEMVSEWP